ncbi:oleosin 18.2 kDa-like [Dorcoceras hygrometricum]|uniref:Oleosin 18.2 kDa-like n=1 Tax=Dorcoceras hygrometricum TaxID=472368 RepID=A0A2Z7CM87_9LAMI|nr:oleosin 18.2 kDa-like [Dorcoceras hygrometricum]
MQLFMLETSVIPGSHTSIPEPLQILTFTISPPSEPPSMAEQQQQSQHPTDSITDYFQEKGPSASQVLAVITLFPIGAVLFCLAGITLAATLLGLAVATPLFLLLSPILLPAILTIAFSVVGFLTSGAFGITALSSVTWLINYFRSMRGGLPEHLAPARRRVQ